MGGENIICWLDGEEGLTYKVTRSEWNCDAHFENCDCPALKADPDIAGIGVVIAFALSASLTLAATVSCLLFSRSDSQDTINPIDKQLRKWVCRPVQRCVGEKRANILGHVFYDMVVCLSDQQLVTGIAMLIAALKKLNDGSATVYHFSLVTDLVWFSSNTHLLSLLVLAFLENSVKPSAPVPNSLSSKQFTAKIPTVLRAVLMVILAGMLLYSTWVCGYIYWYDVPNCPALCTLSKPKGGLPLKWMIANFVFILFSYPLRLFNLWRSARAYWVTSLRHHIVDNRGPGRPDQSDSQQQEHKHGWSLKAAKFVWLGGWYLMTSDISAVLEQIVWHALGYYWTFIDRWYGHDVMRNQAGGQQEIDEENSWGFGQIVPLFLLSLPVIQFFESIAAWSEIYPLRKLKCDGYIHLSHFAKTATQQ